MLRAYRWSGNIRELKNSLATALAFVEGDVLEPRHLRFAQGHGGARDLQNPHFDQGEETPLEQLPLGGQSLESLERIAIIQTLAKHGGNKAQSAQALGISVSTLYEKLKRLGI